MTSLTQQLAAFLKDLEPRFWPKVIVTDDCWWWTGAGNHLGYGMLQAPKGYRRRLMGATHAAWFLVTGELTDGSVHLCHACDNPPCVNPAHLFKGDAKWNIRDCIAKGRFKFPKPRRGEANNKAKLTWEQADEVRRRYASGENLSDLSRSTGRARSTLREVVNGRNWRVEGIEMKPRLKPTARLSDEEKFALISMRQSGVPHKLIASMKGVCEATVVREWKRFA